MMRHFMKNQSEVVTSSVLQSRDSTFRHEFTQAMDSHHELYSLKKGKRFRSAFTTEQVKYLEKEFRKFPYIGNAHRKEVANALNIPERAVKIWFQNRRMKEKKEAVIKEPEFDDQNNRKNVEFTNEQLNNVPAIPSTNDQRIDSLPLLTSHEETPNKSNKEMPAYNSPKVIKETPKIPFYKEISPKQDQASTLNVEYRPSLPVLNNNIVPCYKSSAEFSIDLCKKYRNDLVYKNQSPKEIKMESAPLQLVKQDKIEEKTYNAQNVPEDLSYSKAKCKPEFESIPQTVSPSNVGFQPVYVANYAQPYIPTPNMVWKPVNVMPVMSTGPSAVTISSNLTGNLPVSQQEPVPKKTCNCDCHANVPNTVNFTENAQNPHAQYIITAVPFQNYPKF